MWNVHTCGWLRVTGLGSPAPSWILTVPLFPGGAAGSAAACASARAGASLPAAAAVPMVRRTSPVTPTRPAAAIPIRRLTIRLSFAVSPDSVARRTQADLRRAHRGECGDAGQPSGQVDVAHRRLLERHRPPTRYTRGPIGRHVTRKRPGDLRGQVGGAAGQNTQS